MQTSQHPHTDSADSIAPYRPDVGRIFSALSRRKFATLATVSPVGRPHVAGVLYEIVDRKIYINTMRSSRKARNVETGRRAGVCIPVRRLPIGPPSSVQFQARAEIVALDDPSITAAVAAGHLRSVTGHGELDMPGGCFIRVTLPSRLLTYGLGMSLWTLIRNPLAAAGVVDLDELDGVSS